MEQNTLQQALADLIESDPLSALLLLDDVTYQTTLRDALITRLAHRDLTMYGRQATDLLSVDGTRKSVQIHPYPWFCAGASGVVAYSADNHDIHVVLLQSQDRQQVWSLPGGYAHAGPLRGGEVGLSPLPAKTMDALEQASLHDSNAYQTHYASNPDAFRCWDNAPCFYDSNLEACVIREVHEEIGLRTPGMPTLLLQSSEFDEQKKIHIIENTYLIALENNCPLYPNANEILYACWAPASLITVSTTQAGLRDYRFAGRSIPQRVAQGIEMAISRLRSQQFRLLSQSTLRASFFRFLNQRNIDCEWIKKIPTTSCGTKAYDYHLELLRFEQTLEDQIHSDHMQDHIANLFANTLRN